MNKLTQSMVREYVRTLGGNLTFTRASRSMFLVSSFQPFTVVWPLVGRTVRLQAQWNGAGQIPTTPSTDDQIRDIAQKANRGEL